MFKKIFTTVILFLTSFSVLSAKQSDYKTPTLKELIISSSPVSNGTLIENGVRKYTKEFIVKVYNTSNSELTFATDKGCFIAEDDGSDVRITQKIIEPSLLEPLKPNDKHEGTILFSSRDKSVLQVNFVSWSTSACQYMSKDIK